MKSYKITLFLGEIEGDVTDEESFKDAIKEAMVAAIELDDSGDERLDFLAEEVEEEF